MRTDVWGRRTFDKAVSSKPLAFAADAAPMGIQCGFGTRVLVGRRAGVAGGSIFWRADHGNEAGYCGDVGGVAARTIGPAEYGQTCGVSGVAVRILDLRRGEITKCQLNSSSPVIAGGSAWR